MVWESLSRFDPMQAKRSAAASHIVQRDDFVAPKWPLFTSDEVIELNVNLGQPEYRDQVVILCEYNQTRIICILIIFLTQHIVLSIM